MVWGYDSMIDDNILIIEIDGAKIYRNEMTEILSQHARSIDCKVFIVEKNNGYKTFVLYGEEGNPIYENQNSEAIYSRIEMIRIANMF